jgi:3-oxoadipate enol-lactonase
VTTVLVGGLGTTTRVWQQQLPALGDAQALELPGHGGAAPPAGAVTIESVARDVLERVSGRFSFVGLSLGGMVGQWLGAYAADRLDRLVLACTGAKLGGRDDYRARAALVLREGLEPVVEGARERWFTASFRDDARAQAVIADLRGVDPESYAACCEAVGDWDFRADVGRISVPTLVVFGRDDPVTPPEVRGVFDGFRTVDVPGAHLANVEAPDEFNEQLRSFL